jgi:release factor glutamine methyltransferase
MNWNEYYRYYLAQLQSIYPLQEAAAITGQLFESKTGVTKREIVIAPNKVVDEKHKQILDEALQQLLTHKPLQQITSEAWFYNLRFSINEHVLIPRPETEELVKWILDENEGSLSIIDIGSGSGCIPVALKKNLPNANVTSVDVSIEALLTAKQNAEANETEINFIQLDFLNKSGWIHLSKYDIIVSNPPYIPLSEKEKMDKNVTAYEPHTALFVPTEKPLLFYEQLALFAKEHLNTNGKLYVEIHEEYGKETAALFCTVFKIVEVRKDINGKERMIMATHFR